MTLLAEVRGRGGRLSLAPNGGIDGAKIPTHLIPALKAERQSIIRALQIEQMEGPEYSNTGLYFCIDRHYCDWLMQANSEERDTALEMLMRWDALAWDDIGAAARQIGAEWAIMEQLIQTRPMDGGMLHKAVVQVCAAKEVDNSVFD